MTKTGIFSGNIVRYECDINEIWIREGDIIKIFPEAADEWRALAKKLPVDFLSNCGTGDADNTFLTVAGARLLSHLSPSPLSKVFNEWLSYEVIKPRYEDITHDFSLWKADIVAARELLDRVAQYSEIFDFDYDVVVH